VYVKYRDQELREQARRLMAARQFREAGEAWKDICRRESRNLEAWMMLGITQGELGDYRSAEDSFRRAIVISPRSHDAHHNLGLVLARQSKLEEAAACYQAALDQKHDHLPSRYSLGLVLKDIGRYSESLLHLEAVLATNPAHAWCHLVAGMIHAELGSFEKAATYLEEAARLDSGLAERVAYLLDGIREGRANSSLAKQHVEKLFDQHSESFDQHLFETLGYRIPELVAGNINDILGTDARGLKVLDLGCGTGACGMLLKDIADELTGIDLSPKMIDKARQKGVYDRLVVGDMMGLLAEPQTFYDLIVATDVFIYVGDLQAVFPACARVLRPDGLFAFSVEAVQAASPVLRASGRYGHSLVYLRNLAVSCGLETVLEKETMIRREFNRPIEGYIVILRRPAVAPGGS
jgi:predicted TPR repeat methyltransferase